MKYDLMDNSWLVEMYKLREKWALVYRRNSFCANFTTTQRSESINNFFKKWLNRKLCLSKFVVQYEKALRYFREKELIQDYKSRHTKPILFLELPVLKQAAESYTRKIFIDFEQEVKNILQCCIVDNIGEEQACTFRIEHPDQRREVIVKYDSLNLTISCSCKKFESMGILCMHALKVLNFKNISYLPPQYILMRWTKNARDGAIFNKYGALDSQEPLAL